MTDKEVSPVPLDNYYLFKSCVAGSVYPGMEISTRYVLDSLDLHYTDDPRQSSCTGSAVNQGVIPLEVNLALNARNMSLAASAENPHLTCTCPTSYFNLKHSHKLISKDNKLEKKIKEIMKEVGREYAFYPEVYHIAEVFHTHQDDLAGKVSYPLSGLSMVTHHGCHYTKFFYQEVRAGSFEKPHVLDEVLEKLGGEVLDYSETFLCCGNGLDLVHNQEYSQETLKRKLESIQKVKPDVIVTMCPSCTYNLDYNQKDLENPIPVLYISELLALVMGADPQEVGMDMHFVPVEPVLIKIKEIGEFRSKEGSD